MYLKKLELCGFKSFAERISLDLAPGLNGVVGPNGSGKSNIADALRWVLGEQSAKTLRGGKMEDIIFAGTEHRKPLGYAEITMRLDNSDNALPLEFKEIAVTRRVYRSGESEYSINGENCRLKDIQMLFMDTGIGRDGYSIVGQGRIDEILSLRGEDRRNVFEEAAGISKYKARRGEAMNKLDREKLNRARVDDIITELTEQLEPLEEQSEEARRYLELRDEYKSIHINIFLEDIRKISDDMETTEKSLATALSQSEDGKRLLTESRSASEELKARAANADAKYRRANEDLLETTTSIEQRQSDIKLLESRLEQFETDNTRLAGEAEKRDIGISERDEECGEESQAISTTEAELSTLNTRLAEQLEIAARRDEAMRESTDKMDELNQNVMDAMNAATDSRARVLEAENNYRRQEDDMERLSTETARHKATIEEKTSSASELKSALTACERELEAAHKNQEEYIFTYNRMRTETDALDTEIQKATETLTATRGRYRAISELESQREGYFKSVKVILDKKEHSPRFSGICGAVGELIGVAGEFETAIEIALGSAAQNIITQNEEDAKHAIEFLKKHNEGRATFLPLSAVKGKNLEAAHFKKDAGFIGIAAELVECEAVYAQVISQLLGDFLVVDTLDNALVIHKKYNYSYKIVTKEGERLNPGGAITGGSVSRQSAGIIGRARQLAQLKEEVATQQKNMDELTEKQRELSEKRAATREAMDAVRETVNTAQLEQQSLSGKLKESEDTLKILNEQTAQLTAENEKLLAALAETNTAIRTAKAELSQNEGIADKARETLENYQKELEQNRQTTTEETDIITDLRVEITRAEDKITHAKQTVDRLQKEAATLSEEKQKIVTEITENKKAAEKSAAERAEKTTELIKIQSRLEEARAVVSQSEEEKNTLDNAITKTETEERTQTDATALLEREIARLEARKENLDATSHRLHNEIWEEYNLTAQTAMQFKREDFNETALRKTGQQLKAELAQMTNVNIGAIEAFKQIKTRHEFLTTQREDIIEAEAALEELIQSLTSQMETQFAEKFEEIAAHFQEVFREMFEGGKAKLRLMDTDNVLESGIEIIAQPPGKSLQNLMLLSGGERALTAISLLFAILRMKPSPFCVLDEIESALDDANVYRFANFVKQYAKGTQFIIITHRKGTMEAADNLYGVTMEEQGISKLVSVRLLDE
ncbi:MAG: chromosome segregation protein SMC [Defluviitaleaceae bacterium]|nr:chromosome segregation protein SMC [Defluviitaleaceae bacterium]